MNIHPQILKQGDTIGIMSPSSYIEPDDVAAATHILQSRRYNIHVHPQTFARCHQSAGTNEEKLNAFHDLIQNPDIKAIIFSCGGNRAMHWVDQIDFDLVRNNPKIIMGFSDCTAPLNIINAKTGLVTFHGPTLRWFKIHQDNTQDINQCFDVLSGKKDTQTNDKILVGGNLSLFQYLLNDVDLNGKTLFLEDWNIELSYLDRMFMHLKRQGVFDQINGLILGQFENLTDTGRPFGFTFDDIIAEHVPTSLPLTTNAPFGHGNRLITMPIGLQGF